jgi:glycosyltransferase involved in cell wall biosynthesis
MAKPRLVYLCTRFPYPFDRGDRLRAFRLLQQFSKHADVTLVTFTEGLASDAPVEPLLAFCDRVEVVPLARWESRLGMLAGITRKEPFQVSYYHSSSMEQLVDRLAREKFDVAFAQLFRMRPYLDRFVSSRRVIELSDSLTLNLRRALPFKPIVKRWAFEEELRRVDRYERETLSRVEEAWVVSGPDRQDLLARSPQARVEVIPNGVETRWGQSGLEGPKQNEAIFLGNLTVSHNRDAARHLVRDIWPLVRKRIPDATLRLVGKHDANLRSLASKQGVILSGFVEDLSPVFRCARIALAPLRFGSGLQNKVLEAMASGLPVVATPLVSQPINAEPEREILIATTAAEQAEAACRLLKDDGLAMRVGQAARAFVLSRFTWDCAGKRMQEILHG